VVYLKAMFPDRRLVWVACFAVLGSGSSAMAQTAKPPPPAAPSPRFAIPGSPDSASKGSALPAASKKSKRPGRGAASTPRPRPGAPVATFPGFRLLPDGKSRIYVEVTKSVSVDERRVNGGLVYTLRGAQVLVRNNKNALITTHFATPVARARLVPAGDDVDLVIDLRKAVAATHQVVASDNGTARLEIDFPAGDYPLAPGLYQPPPGTAGRALRGGDLGSNEEEGPAEEPEAKPSRTAPAATGKAGVGPPTP